ncbi:MAG: LysR family transcriptional regulator [Lachnospiraceae bacterium]|nr:LysR family transcriptional regulator [Lachnospiraceae bacterium]
MHLQEQEYFVLLAQEKSFTKAAEKACISQPALSKAIAKLEQDYGCAFIDRSEKRLKLTEAGRLYLQSAERMLELRRQALQRIHSLQQNIEPRLRIGINRQYSQQRFVQTLWGHYREYPGELPDVYEIDSRQTLEMLRSGLLDMAVALQIEGRQPRDLTAYPLSEEQLAAYLPDTPAFKSIIRKYSVGSCVPLELFHEKDVIHNRQGSNLDKVLQNYFREQGFRPHYICSISDTLTSVEAVRNGIGMLFNYQSRAETFRLPHYYRLTPAPALRHYIFLRPNTPVTPQMEFLIRLLQHET